MVFIHLIKPVSAVHFKPDDKAPGEEQTDMAHLIRRKI